MPKMRRGLRLRIGAAFAVFTLVVVLSATIGIFLVTDSHEEAFIEQILSSEMVGVQAAYRARGEVGAPDSSTCSRLYVLRPSEDPQKPAARPPRPARGRPRDIPRRQGVSRPRERRPGTRFYVLYDASRHEDRIEVFKHFLLLAVLAAAAISAGVGYWLVGLVGTPSVRPGRARVASRSSRG